MVCGKQKYINKVIQSLHKERSTFKCGLLDGSEGERVGKRR